MARERIVSRTIKGFIYVVKAYDENTDSLREEKVVVLGDNPENKRLKELNARLENKGLSLVKVLALEEFERLYGMKEEEFIKLARPM